MAREGMMVELPGVDDPDKTRGMSNLLKEVRESTKGGLIKKL